MHWDALRLFGDITAGLRKAGAAGDVASVGVDTWGVDFGLLDERGRLLANPVHYRDARTDGMVERAFALVPRDEIYATTGIQFMAINTVYQLLAMASADDPLLRHADRLLMMADLFAHFLSGASVAEYTLASTSQALDARARDWARPMLERLGIPTRLLPEIVAPGTVVGRPRRRPRRRARPRAAPASSCRARTTRRRPWWARRSPPGPRPSSRPGRGR